MSQIELKVNATKSTANDRPTLAVQTQLFQQAHATARGFHSKDFMYALDPAKFVTSDSSRPSPHSRPSEPRPGVISCRAHAPASYMCSLLHQPVCQAVLLVAESVDLRVWVVPLAHS